MKVLFCLNGRSALGILADVRREFPDHTPRVVVLPNDSIQPPEGVDVSTVEETVKFLNDWDPQTEGEVVVVANGGVTKMLVPIVVELVKGWEGFRGAYKLVELQRGESPCIFSKRNTPLDEFDKAARDLSESEARTLYTQTSW